MTKSSLKIGNRNYRKIDLGVYKVNYAKLDNFKPGDLPIHSSIEITGIKQVDKIKLTISVVNGNDIDTKEYYSIHYFFETKSLNRKVGIEKIERIHDLLSDLVIKRILPLASSIDLSRIDRFKDIYSVGYYDSGEHLENIILKTIVDQILIKFSMAARNVKAFLCHAHEDKAVVELFAKKLNLVGKNVWFDKWEIKVGDSIVEKINNGLENMTHLVIFISNNSVSKPWVKKELSVGLMRKLSDNSVQVIPILLDKVELPAILKDIKYADCIKNREVGFKSAIESLNQK
jgi:hypothetical protein